MAINTFPLILDSAFMLTPKVKHFVFRHESPEEFIYRPGQFITLHFENANKPLRRSYSIANVPSQHNRIEIAASFIEGGPGSTLLFHLKPGEVIQASGPYGRLVLKDSPLHKRAILIATSTGVTPYRAMIGELIQRMESDSAFHVVLLEGIQKHADILYNAEFTTLAEQYPRFLFRACLSRENKTDVCANEIAGHVQDAFPDLNLNPENDIIYLCGNPSMIDEAFEQLKEKGFPMQHIIREKYISR